MTACVCGDGLDVDIEFKCVCGNVLNIVPDVSVGIKPNMLLNMNAPCVCSLVLRPIFLMLIVYIIDFICLLTAHLHCSAYR